MKFFFFFNIYLLPTLKKLCQPQDGGSFGIHDFMKPFRSNSLRDSNLELTTFPLHAIDTIERNATHRTTGNVTSNKRTPVHRSGAIVAGPVSEAVKRERERERD